MLYIVKKVGQEAEARKRHPSPMEEGIEFLAEISWEGTDPAHLTWVMYRGELVGYHDFVINDRIYTLDEVRKYRPKMPGRLLADDDS